LSSSTCTIIHSSTAYNGTTGCTSSTYFEYGVPGKRFSVLLSPESRNTLRLLVQPVQVVVTTWYRYSGHMCTTGTRVPGWQESGKRKEERFFSTTGSTGSSTQTGHSCM
jgi:hypothetical protein